MNRKSKIVKLDLVEIDIAIGRHSSVKNSYKI